MNTSSVSRFNALRASVSNVVQLPLPIEGFPGEKQGNGKGSNDKGWNYLLSNTVSFSKTVDHAIRIQKPEGSKYILRYSRDDVIEEVELKDYEKKGVIDLFVLVAEKDQLFSSLSNSACYEMALTGSLSSMRNGLSLAQSMFEESGYNPDSIQLVEELTTSLHSKLEEESKKTSKGALIKSILDSKDDLFFKKVSLQTIFGMDILKKEDWAIQMHYDIYNFMSTFSDITLTKSDMILISTEDEFDRSLYTSKELDIIDSHALRAFKLIENYEAKPVNVDLLILEHHGMKSGIGFSKNIGSNLNKIVVIYRIAENIAIEILRKKSEKQAFTLNDIVDSVDKKFESPRVRSTLKNII